MLKNSFFLISIFFISKILIGNDINLSTYAPNCFFSLENKTGILDTNSNIFIETNKLLDSICYNSGLKYDLNINLNINLENINKCTYYDFITSLIRFYQRQKYLNIITIDYNNSWDFKYECFYTEKGDRNHVIVSFTFVES